ncbi:MAG: adenylosuccinate lyase [Pseudomonadota bacterium]|nr:adenylosuccinate lyase [Pseudomonadota bacterium]
MQRHAAILATYPNIPSQRQERYLGYDIEFKLTQSSYSVSVFIQHKVAHFAEVRSGSNARFFNTHNEPYFRFPVDNDQHTILQKLSSARGNTFYCAPLFHSRDDLHNSFQNGSISQNVILLDPNAVAPVAGKQRHNISYDRYGRAAFMHSETVKFDRIHVGHLLEEGSLKKRKIDIQELNEVVDNVLGIAFEFAGAHKVLEGLRDAPKIVQAQVLLGNFFGVSWLII